MALEKKHKDPLNTDPLCTRPNAVGETLRRLISKVLLTQPPVRSAVHSLRPLQCGVSTSNGALFAPMALQQGIQTLMAQGDTYWAVMTVDLSNAFNSVKGATILQSAISTCPEIVPWVASMYGTHSSLFCQSRIIQSQSGVQQGDPLGPLLFAWALHPTAYFISSTVPWCSWYLDDGALIGTRVQLETALAALQSETSRTGLRVNLSKCQVWGPATPASLPKLDCVTPVPFVL